MSAVPDQLPKSEEQTLRRYLITGKGRRIEKKLDLIQKRACSSLAELSSSICQEDKIQERVKKVKTQNFSLFSPWKSKVQQKQNESMLRRVKSKRSTLYELSQLKKGAPCYNQRKSNCRILRSSHRNHTENKENVLEAVPSILKTQALSSEQRIDMIGQLKIKAYTSQQVIHITHPLKESLCQNRNTQKQNKILIPSQAQIECKPYFKDHYRNQNGKTGIISTFVQGKLVHNAMAIRSSQKKKLKRMFIDSKNPQKSFSTNKQMSGLFNLNSIPGSNPVSRTLLEKYLLVLSEQNKENF